MKNLKNIVLAFLCLTAFNSIGQTVLDKGVIKMEITDVNSDNEQMAAQLEMMKGTSTEYYFNSEKSLTESNIMGGMMQMRFLFDNKSEDLTLLFDVMGQKMCVESSKDERKDVEAKQKEAMEGVKVVYDESDMKEILGYKCVKASLEGGESDMNFSMYVAKEIKASNDMIQGLQGIEIEGFPLEYIMDMGQGSLTYSATKIDKELDPSVFKVNTSGYTKMTMEEFSEQMGGMGQGMGF
mgnify:CR=1 FL=1